MHYNSMQIIMLFFSCKVMSNSLQPHKLQHTRLPCSYLSEFVHFYVHLDGDTIQPPHPQSPHLLLPSIFPSIKVFSSESALHIRCPKYWSFSFSISPSNEYSGFISFRINWFNLLVVQGNLKSLLQHHNLKASNYYKQEQYDYIIIFKENVYINYKMTEFYFDEK